MNDFTSPQTFPVKHIAESTVRRLSLYLRFLEEFEAKGHETISSGELAAFGGTTSAQVRKDLARIYPGATAQLFSSLKRTGTAEALACIEAWVAAQKQKAPAKGE